MSEDDAFGVAVVHLRSQLATIQNTADEMVRDVRRTGLEVEAMAHAMRSLRAAIATAFDELEKIDLLAATATAATDDTEKEGKA